MNRLRPFRFGVICEQMQSAEEWIMKAFAPVVASIAGEEGW